MGWVIAALLVTVLLASPWIAADSRDGADWKPLRTGGRTPRHAVRPWSASPGAVAVRKGVARFLRRRRGGRRGHDTAPAGRAGRGRRVVAALRRVPVSPCPSVRARQSFLPVSARRTPMPTSTSPLAAPSDASRRGERANQDLAVPAAIAHRLSETSAMAKKTAPSTRI